MQRMEGPYIEEVFDSPPRRHNSNRRELRVARLRELISDPATRESRDMLREVLDLLKEDKRHFQDEQDNENIDHQKTISTLANKINQFERMYDRAVDDYEARKEESRRIEEARRTASFGGSHHNVTARDNRSKLYQSSQRHYSSDEENEEYATRDRRQESRRDTRQDTRNYDSDGNDTRDHQSSSSAYQRHDDTSRRQQSTNQQSSSSAPIRMRPGKSRVTKTNSRKWRPGQKALSEIRKYQKSTDLLIQKAPFYRVVQEILRETSGFTNDHRIRADAIAALQEAAEAFIVEMFEGATLLSTHAKRVTLMPSDIQLYRRLCLRHL